MEQMHSLLKRQLKQYFSDLDSIPESLQSFIDIVNKAYWQTDIDRGMLERSLDLSSQELLQANSEMRAIFKALPDLFFRLDNNGKILDYRVGSVADLYLQPEDLLGKKIQDIPFGDVGEKFQKIIQKVQETGTLSSMEYSLKHRGQEDFYEARLMPLMENQIIVIIRNITKHKQAEAEMERGYQLQEVLNTLLRISLEDIPFEEILKKTLDLIIATPFMPKMPKGGILLVDENSDILTLKVHVGFPKAIQTMCAQVPFGKCLCGRAAASGRIQFADHIDERHEHIYDGILPHGHYNIPIISKDKVLGVIVLYLQEGHICNEKDKEFLKAVADTLAGIIERKKAEEEIAVHLRLLENMENIEHVIRHAIDIEQMMSDVLQATLDIFKADRAWLLFPCDPDAKSWSVPMERTRPEYPGAFALGEDIPMLPEARPLLREALDKNDVITVDTREPGAPKETHTRFLVMSQMHMAVHPQLGKPWLFGIHQCSHYRDWTEEDKDLFREIGHRIGDALSSQLFLRDLRVSEEKWKTLTVNSQDHIMLLDRNYIIRFINRSVPDLTIQQVIGKSNLDFIPADYRQDAVDCFKRVILTGKPDRFETKYNTVEGEIQYFEVRISGLTDKDGNITGFISTSNNITWRKQAEEELVAHLDQTRRLRDVVEKLNRANTLKDVYSVSIQSILTVIKADRASILLVDPDGVVRFKAWEGLSPNYRKVTEGHFPWEHSDLKAQHICIPDISKADLAEDLRKTILKEGIRACAFFPLIGRGQLLGKFMTYYDHAHTFGSDEINVAGVLADNLSTVIERLQSQKALIESEIKYRSLFEDSRDAIFVSSSDGSFIDFNQAAEELFGYCRGELLDFSIEELYTNKNEYRQFQEEIEEQGFVKDFEIQFRKKDGTIIDCLETASVRKDPDGNFIGHKGIIRDITEYKRAEAERQALKAQVRQSQKLEVVGTMAGGIAHDFNNILQSMFLYGEVVKEQLPDDEVLQKNFQHILDDGDRARNLVQQILTFSRKSKIDLKPRSIQYIVLDALSFERASLPANIEIQQNIDMNCGMVLCDKTQVHQVVINLCNNAKHAIGNTGGTVYVSLQQVQAPIRKKSTKTKILELKVTDTGPGMDAETLSRIFDPFFTTKAVGEGTGLGMSVIYGIVEMMNGQINATSEVDKGTMIQILLPLAEEKEEVSTKEVPLPAEDTRTGILLVDDEESIREAGKTVLDRKGYTVDIAADGDSAFELFKANPNKYDLIITDLSMPTMSGVELAYKIRNSGSIIPIILTSGNLDVNEKNEYHGKGISTFLQKPWTANQLIKCIVAVREIN